VSIFFLVLAQVLLAQARQVLQARPSPLRAQARQARPSARLVSAPAAVIDCSPT